MANSNKVQQQGWGGPWTEQKLDCFESYVRAYLTIMNKYRFKFKWNLVYFDGFAGCGDREQQAQSQEDLFSIYGEEALNSQDLHLYAGAAERVMRLETPDFRGFDLYYFVDKYEENLTRLELKLSSHPTIGKRFFLNYDANHALSMLAKSMRDDANKVFVPGKPRNLKTLCLLDPFGMSIDWSSIVNLAGPSIDLWILVPTGSIVSRLIQRDGTLRYPERLERFFGIPRDELIARFYTVSTETDIFGEEHRVMTKVENTISVISRLYCEQLGTLFPFVTNEPLVLKNKNNVPLFSFVCASYNQTAVKIAKQIIDKRQK